MNSKSLVRPDARLSVNFTSLVGRVVVAYLDLVRVFGQPNRGSSGDNKVDCEWVLRTPSGVATIYNYKSGKNYLGDDGLDVEYIRDWHIGGRNSVVADHVTNALGEADVVFGIVK